MYDSNYFDDYLKKHFGKKIFNVANEIYSKTSEGVDALCKNCDRAVEFKNLFNVEPSLYIKYINCQQIGSFYCYYDPNIDLTTQQTLTINVTDENSISRFEEGIIKECSLFDLVVDDQGFPSSGYFFPIDFACHAMINYLKNFQVDHLRKNINLYPKNSFNAYLLLSANSLLNMVNSILLCFERNNYEIASAYALLRTLIESYVTQNALIKEYKKNKNIIKDYEEFTKILLDGTKTKAQKGRDLNAHFNTTIFNRERNTCEWLKIPNTKFKYKGCYSFEFGLKNTSIRSADRKLISDQYDICNHYVHGTALAYNAKRKDLYRAQYITGMILEFLATDLQNEYGEDVLDFKHNGIDLFYYLDCSKNECLNRMNEQVDEPDVNISCFG